MLASQSLVTIELIENIYIAHTDFACSYIHLSSQIVHIIILRDVFLCDKMSFLYHYNAIIANILTTNLILMLSKIL